MTTTDLDLGKYKLGWSDDEDYVFKPKKGLNEAIVREMSAMKNEPRVDARLPAPRAAALREAPDGRLVRRQHARPRLRRHLLLHQADVEPGRAPGTSCPTRSRTPTRSWASPRRSASTWPASPPSTSREVVYHRNREDLEAQGVLFCDMDTALREYPELVKQVLRQDHPAQRQQVRRPQLGGVVGRLVHLRAARA